MSLVRKKVETVSQDDSIRKYLGFNLKMLSFIGLEFKLNNEGPVKKSRLMQSLPICITETLGLSVVTFEFIFIVHILRYGNKNLIAMVLSEMFTRFLCTSKSISMLTAIETIRNTLIEMSILWTKYRPNQDCREEITKKAQQTLNLSRYYLFVILLSASVYTLPPYFNFLYYRFIAEVKNYTLAFSKKVAVSEYPFEINDSLLFFCLLTKEAYMVTMSGIYWVTCDALFAQLTTHVCLQLKILYHDMKTMLNHETEESRLKANIIQLVKRHQNLLRVCKLIESIFSPVIFATVLLSASSICTYLFEVKLLNAEKNYDGTIIFKAVMVINLLLQILFYCAFAELLTNQTSLISESVYTCKWTEKNANLRFYLQMIIMKSQVPFYCTGFGFFSIGHTRMASIVSTSFSYLMVLQSIS